ncbi:ce7303bf-9278-48e3-8345-00a1e71a899c [Thermothielavioides terrestris]|uniref:Ce7303bf-9278-48e3-8345-00a1e71a899c n=1 Tax=Thermothielavioides terrestris TaxID=2587410 RepID=A0A3S4D8K1_9PEZI|nr:ce7303bf-9278-48e3-8345-00a1e71a899c [Thermothielavioides terrestris]
MDCFAAPAIRTRDAIEDIWGPRTPYKDEWPTRVDYALDEEPEAWVQSACVLCSNGCGLDIGVKDGRVVGVRGRATDRVNKGRLGPKGLTGWKAIHSKDRLTYPMVRKNGRLERATWDEAMGLIVAKSKELQKHLTNHSIAFYTSGQLFLEEYYALALVGKAGLHTLHMDGNTRLCTATAAASMRESFGSDGQPGSYADIDYTDCLFMLVVVDPRLSETARKATLHLAPRVGTNLALLNGIQHLMFKNGWIDEDYVSKHVIGRSESEKVVGEYDPDTVEKVTGVPVKQLEEAARIIGTAKSLVSTALQGVYQSNQATASACQINNINLLRGMIGKPGCGILQMNGQPTAQNNREAGCDGEFPGFRNHQNPTHMKELAELWNIDPIHVPHWNEPTHVQNLLNYIESGSVRMFWISGTNPLVSLPNLTRIRNLLTQPGLFVVCQDIYMTETAAIADVVLPAAQWGEKTGCFTNADRTVHISHKAVEPPGECKSDLDIFLDYAKRMGFKDKDGNDLIPWTTPEEVFEAWKKVSAGRPCDYTGLSYERLTGGSGIQWPCNEKNPQGTERLYTDGVFPTDIDYCESFGHDPETGAPYTKQQYMSMNPAGRAILKACHYSPPLEEPDEEFPLRLSTGRKVHQFHTRTKTGRTALQKACPEPEVRVSEKDAASAGVSDGEMVIVRSRRGAVELKCSVGGIAEGQVFVPFHFGYWDSQDGRARAANELTFDRWDPISKQPYFKSGAVRLEKIPSPTSTNTSTGAPHIREQHSDAIRKAAAKSAAATTASASASDLAAGRERQLEHWLGETYETAAQLEQIYTTLLPSLIDDLEVEAGLRVLRRIGEDMRAALAPHARRHGYDVEDRLRSGSSRRRAAQALRDALFPPDRESETTARRSPLEVLRALQALAVYLAHIEVGLTALLPAAQALWDEAFVEAVIKAQGCLDRMQGWVRHQVKVRSPQTLVVPVRKEE